ncbi:MAG TPA: NAD-dependent malic enzyme [Firmicutes bacterium]|nr:NAD-dependent malic enzyme [Bacillota bacterium]
MNIYEKAVARHKEWRGKVEITSKAKVTNAAELSLAYSPGVAEPCRRIAEDKEAVWDYTWKGNTIAIVSDGSAVLGLGNIGPDAALPVMEGKAVLFKEFANVDAIPLCLNTQDVDEIVQFVKALEPTVAGVNLEDISSPRCFEIEARLKAETGMFIFHDDQHGTAVVALAGLINALKVVGKDKDAVLLVNGVGAAGGAIIRLLVHDGYKNIIACGRQGRLIPGDPQNNAIQEEIAQITNPHGKKQNLQEALVRADVFIGVSAANILTPEMVKGMNDQPIIMALANPEPEIAVDLAIEAGAAIVATGRSDYPNQINNVLGFPGIFRGALDVRATDINDEMKVAAAYAIASLVEKPSADCIIPSPFDTRVGPAVAQAVAETARKTGATRKV